MDENIEYDETMQDEDLEAAMSALEEDQPTDGDYSVGDNFITKLVDWLPDIPYDPSVATKSVSEMTPKELEAARAALRTRETTLFTKTRQPGDIITYNEDGTRLDEQAIKNGGQAFGGTLTETEYGEIHYEGELGSFTYKPAYFALGEKEVVDYASGVTTTIPVLKYIGWMTEGNDIAIPEGIKSIDYMFEDDTDLETIPVIPEGVKSAHGAFFNCESATRACSDAKTGEHDETGWNWATVGAATTAGAGLGFAFPLVGNLVGAVGGAVVGMASGAVAAVTHRSNHQYKGGVWKMPDSLEDASFMFSGCSNLTEAFTEAGTDLKFTRGMYMDNVALGSDEIANKYGSVCVTNAKDYGMVSKEAAQETYSGVSDDTRRIIEGTVSEDGNQSIGWSDNWDEESQTFTDPNATAEEKAVVEQGSQILKEKDAREGESTDEMFQKTGGLAAYNAVYKQGVGYVKTEDMAAKSDPKPDSAFGFGDLRSLIDRGVASLGEFWILKKFTGSTIVSGIATFGLQAVNILPKSMKPILDVVTGFVGEDSKFGQILQSISDMIPGGTEVAEESVLPAQSDSEEMSLDDKMAAEMQSVQTIVTKADGTIDIQSAMYRNGMDAVQDGVFADVALKQPNDPELSDVTAMSLTMAASLEDKAIRMAGGEGAALSDEDKELLACQCMSIMDGLSAYQQGAVQQIDTLRANGHTDKAQRSMAGLGNVMHATATPFLDAIKDMDSVYGFLSDEDKEKLSNLELIGVENYDTYQVGDIVHEVAKDENEMLAEQSLMTAEIEVIPEAGTSEKLTSDVVTFEKASAPEELTDEASVSTDAIYGTKRPDRPMPEGINEDSEENEQDGYEF